ncbi:MAG: hypothetical protein Kow0099_18120 [Candidatus Abyssubacteria bacterium]
MAYRTDEVKVGLVIVISLLILAGFILAILGIKLGQPTEMYTTAMRFAGGIEPGTIVRFGGMDVGQVSRVGVSPTDNTLIELTMRVNEGVPIKTDSVVYINTIGFLGDYYLEITTGSQDAALLPPGSNIQSREIVTFHDVIARAQSAVERLDAALVIVNDKILAEHMPELRRKVETMTDKMTELLTDADEIFNEQNRKNIGEALAELNALLRENRHDITETIANFRVASQRLESLATTLDSVATDKREEIESLIHDIRTTAEEIGTVTDRIEQLVAENASDIAVTIDNLKAASSNARDFSETISDEPWRLIWRTPLPEKKTIEKEAGAGVP